MPDEIKPDEKQDIPCAESSMEIDQGIIFKVAAILGERFVDYAIICRPNAAPYPLVAKWSNREWATGAFETAQHIVHSREDDKA